MTETSEEQNKIDHQIKRLEYAAERILAGVRTKSIIILEDVMRFTGFVDQDHASGFAFRKIVEFKDTKEPFATIQKIWNTYPKYEEVEDGCIGNEGKDK